MADDSKSLSALKGTSARMKKKMDELDHELAVSLELTA